jgi:hypothetical protein
LRRSSYKKKYCLDGVLGEWARSEGGEGARREFLPIDVLIVPGSGDEAERVAGVVGKPVIGVIAAIELMVVEEDIESDEDAGSVVADHQHVAEEDHQHED